MSMTFFAAQFADHQNADHWNEYNHLPPYDRNLPLKAATGQETPV